MAEPILSVRGLETRFTLDEGVIRPSRAIDLDIASGEVVGLVGESGSGKSVTARAMVRLLEPESALVGGTIRYKGEDVRAMPQEALARLRAREIAIVVQDPSAALNPVMTVGAQLTRIHRLHGGKGGDRAAAREAALALLRRVRIADPEARLASYPHQLSGGMRQRVLIAMALICRPALLIADEPTTALDVTVEAEILALLGQLRRELGMAILLISHNLAAIARLADRVAVMYAGRIVEVAPVRALFRTPRHPYTRALLASVPRGSKHDAQLEPIAGEPPDLRNLPPGCPFQGRCPDRVAACAEEQDWREGPDGGNHACHRGAELAK
jgi:oligopeptide/dipeptide ABC transporter ATP-binding protein